MVKQILLGLGIALALTLASQPFPVIGAGPVVSAHVLRVTTAEGDVSTLNRHLSADYAVSLLSQLTSAYLVRYDRNDKPIPELATVLPSKANRGISADGKTIVWHLRRGVRWSDGVPFSADDVVYTVKAVLNPANNALAYSDFKALVTNVEEPNRFTILFRLHHPYAGFIPTLFGSAGANPCILPKHVLAAYSTMNQVPYNALPVGIGPFRYTKWVRGDRIELQANPYYWRGPPKLARIVFLMVGDDATAMTMLQTHALDLFIGPGPASLARLSLMQGVRVLMQPSMEFAVLAFNVRHPVVADVRIRRAVEMAIDRGALLRKIRRGFGSVQESIVPPGLPITPSMPLVRYNLAGARALLDRAGWPVQPDGIRAKNGTRLSLAVSYDAQSTTQSGTVEYVRAMLHDAGIELRTKAVASARFWDTYAAGGELFAGNWDATFVTWTFPSSGDLSNLLACNQFPPAGQNIDRFCDASLDRAMAAYAASYDLARSNASMQRAAEILARDLPMISLNIPVDGYAMTSRVERFAPGSLTPLDVPTMMDVDAR